MANRDRARALLVLGLALSAQAESVRVFVPDGMQSRRVKSGSSYRSQSELTLTFGLGRREADGRVVIEWPSGAVQEFKNVAAGSHRCTEGQPLTAA